MFCKKAEKRGDFPIRPCYYEDENRANHSAKFGLEGRITHEETPFPPAALSAGHRGVAGGGGGAGGLPVRFILNESRAIATNSFLMLYPKGALARFVHGDAERNEVVWSVLLGISAQDIRNAGRSYGGGLQKVEPRELARVPCRGLEDLLGHSETAGGHRVK